MKNIVISAAFAAASLAAGAAGATGLATCDSGPKETWQPQAKLEKMLTDKGWKINRVKEDGGCWEVYATDENGKRTEAYFHPKTLEYIPTQRGQVVKK
jgi:hypothetical protein